MSSDLRYAAALCCLIVASACQANQAAPPLLVLQKQEAPQGGARPSAERFHTALGKRLAARLQREARMVDMPRNRIAGALEAGDADILCGYLPQWLGGAYDWSRPFIPVAEVVVSSAHVPAPRTLEELRGKRIGAVLGFRYPEVEKVLGTDFRRDDGPSEAVSLQKMLAGRFDYVLSTRATVEAQTQRATLPHGINVLVFKEYRTMCAVSRKGQVRVEELNEAIDAIDKSGELEQLLRLR